MAGSAMTGARGRSPLLLYVAPSTGFFLSHRLPLAIAARDAGYAVHVASPPDTEAAVLEAHGFNHHALPLRRAGTSPGVEATTAAALLAIFRQLKPALAHLITAKPALYGGLAGRLTGTPTVAAITGLGFVFVRNDCKTRLMRWLLFAGYRVGLDRADNHFIFQNTADRSIFAEAGLLRTAHATLIPGSGTDLSQIAPQPLPGGKPVVLLPARMLVDKGVREFIEAARLLHAKGVPARLRLLGDPDPANPGSLSLQELRNLDAEGVVEWRPHSRNIAAELAQASVVALPSYREGFPKTLIDAAAAGRAMVASDVPGCRDAVLEGETGILCTARHAGALAGAIEALVSDRARMESMGKAARADAERRFDITDVVARHLIIYEATYKRSRL